jgi:hypothetical protein|nr:hypothetical protein [uncultured Desulfobacter sp.]
MEAKDVSRRFYLGRNPPKTKQKNIFSVELLQKVFYFAIFEYGGTDCGYRQKNFKKRQELWTQKRVYEQNHRSKTL